MVYQLLLFKYSNILNVVIVYYRDIYNHLQKALEILRKFKKSCKHKENINGIYNEKLHKNYLQQLPTLRLKT